MAQHIVICGAGTMRGGIAISCLAANLDVTVINTLKTSLDNICARVAANLARQVDKCRITAAAATRQAARLFVPVLEAFGEGIAAPEDFDLGEKLALRFDHGPIAQMQSLEKDRARALIEQLCNHMARPCQWQALVGYSPQSTAE